MDLCHADGAQKNLKALCSSQHFKSYRDLLAQCRVLCNLVCLGDFVGESAFAEDDDQQEEPMPGDDGAAEAALPTTLVGRGSTLTGRHGPRARSNGPTQFFSHRLRLSNASKTREPEQFQGNLPSAPV